MMVKKRNKKDEECIEKRGGERLRREGIKREKRGKRKLKRKRKRRK